MTREEQGQLLAAHRSYRRTQLLFVMLLLGNFLAAAASLYWASRQFSARQADAMLSQALPLLLVALAALGLSAILVYRHLARQGHATLRQGAELLDTQHRLQHQQQVWRHLRELHQEDIPEEHFLEAVQVALKELLGIQRISLWFFDDPPGTLTCRSSLDPSLVGTRLAMEDLDTYIDTLIRAPCLAASQAQEDPRLTGLHPYLMEHGVMAMLDVGVFVGGELRGTLCCESSHPRHWRADEINSVMGVSGLLSQFAESLRRREIEDDLHRHIHYDAVTGLPTLRGIAEALDQMTTRLRAFQLIVIRVRGLGHVNALLGQSGGDEALRQVAAEIRRHLLPQRKTPRLARLPANQLAIVLPGDPRDAWLQQRLEAMLATLAENVWHVHAQPCQLRFAAGMAHFPGDGGDLETVLQRAELALKRAREQAQTSLEQYAPELGEWELHRIRIQRELRTALVTQQFRLYLQPQFDFEGRLRGAEVLLRWQHPENGLMAPGQFIEEAERSGLISPIGHWVLEQAVALLRGPLAASELTLSVNVSIQQLRDEDFIPRIESLLDRGDFAPRRLVLEIVESLLATPGMAATLQALRQLGVQLALDDFGTGYSSLRYLQEFPVDEIKLDKVFIDPLQNGTDAPLARSIIALARTLHLRLVAEGVEVASQIAFLRRQRVDLMQGYYLAHPEPVDTFLARLDAPA